MNSYDIIIKPVLTEKSSADNINNKYHFWVQPKSTKNEIKNAIEKLYGIKVLSVNTNLYRVRKEKRKGTRIVKLGTNYKKAVVEVEKGKVIELLSKSE